MLRGPRLHYQLDEGQRDNPGTLVPCPLSKSESRCRASERFATDVDVDLTITHRETERHPPVEARCQLSKQLAIEAVQFQGVGAMDALSGELTYDLPRVLVSVHSNPSGCFARFVQARRVRSPDVDPHLEGSGEVANGDARLVWLGEPFGKAYTLGVFEAVGDHPRKKVLLGFRWMPRDPESDGFVDTTVDVGQLDVEVVNGRGEGHASS